MNQSTTDYKAIADRLVERGFKKGGLGYWLPGSSTMVDARTFCHDWRVAGACMERAEIGGSWGKSRDRHDWFAGIDTIELTNDSLPFAIILAYLEATDGA